ncbi:cytochrome P450 71A1-like protein [Tanacetum coccineum]
MTALMKYPKVMENAQEVRNVMGKKGKVDEDDLPKLTYMKAVVKETVSPEDFLPERFLGSDIDFKGSNFEFIPFGAGRSVLKSKQAEECVLES